MSTPRRVRLFKNGRSQAVRIPREFELAGTEATIHKEGLRLVIEPMPDPALGPNAGLLALLASWAPLDEEIGPIEDFPPAPVDL